MSLDGDILARVPVPSELYDRDYYLSDRVEGWEHFRDARGLSAIKQHELALLGITPGQRLLDAGCGRGEVLLAAANRGARVAGIDYSEAAVEIAGETLSSVDGADIRHGDVTALPWPDASFDRVLLADVIEHLDPDQMRAAVRELHRVLRPGGRVLVHTAPNRLFTDYLWPVARPLLRAVGHGEAARGMDFWIQDTRDHGHVNEMTLHGMRRALGRAGFADVRTWIDPNVLRVGRDHHLTRSMESSPAMQLAGRVAGLRPLRLFLGNDLYAICIR